MLVFGLVGLSMPDSVPAVPQTKSAPAVVLLVVGGAFLALLTYRAAAHLHAHAPLRRPHGRRRLRLARRDAVDEPDHRLHDLRLPTSATCSRSPRSCSSRVPAALDIKRAGASRPLVGDLTATELVASEEAYLGPRVRALMVQLEQRDVSTEEHTRRVALLAAQVGEELRLSATARRHLAVGGLLHDIGKLAVPLDILNKPGKLTDEEFAAIKRHPGDGRKLLEELGGFPEPVRGLVSDHHERLDGSGYPRGL